MLQMSELSLVARAHKRPAAVGDAAAARWPNSMAVRSAKAPAAADAIADINKPECAPGGAAPARLSVHYYPHTAMRCPHTSTPHI